MFVLRAGGILSLCRALTIRAALDSTAVSGASQLKVLYADATHDAASPRDNNAAQASANVATLAKGMVNDGWLAGRADSR